MQNWLSLQFLSPKTWLFFKNDLFKKHLIHFFRFIQIFFSKCPYFILMSYLWILLAGVFSESLTVVRGQSCNTFYTLGWCKKLPKVPFPPLRKNSFMKSLGGSVFIFWPNMFWIIACHHTLGCVCKFQSHVFWDSPLNPKLHGTHSHVWESQCHSRLDKQVLQELIRSVLVSWYNK
jgi:hypothetical protein